MTDKHFELEHNRAYLDFYEELEALRNLPMSDVIFSKPPNQSRFEASCGRLYDRILMASYRTHVEARPRSQNPIQQFIEFTDELFQKIYKDRLIEFTQLAGLYGDKWPSEFFFDFVPQNARGHTSSLFHALEKKLLEQVTGEGAQIAPNGIAANNGGKLSIHAPQNAEPREMLVSHGLSGDGLDRPKLLSAEESLAAVRRGKVMPILDAKRWTRGKWATNAGVGKNCVYEYLNGKRNPGFENRKAMAEALDLRPEELPE